MTKRKLKLQLKQAYIFDESKEETAFIRTHEQRSLRLWDIILDELKYLGWNSVLSGAILYVVLLIVSMQNQSSTIWCLSSFLPLLALLMTTVIRRSERFGMSELEAVCRFSLRFVRQIRMLIIGVASLILILLSTLIACRNNTSGFAVVMCAVSFPYLLNVFSNLLITRKCHFKDDLFFCALATGFSCLVPSIAKSFNIIYFSNTLAVVLLVMTLSAAGIEAIKYIQEGAKPYETCIRQCV